MVCSCAILSICILLQIIFCSRVIKTTLLCENDRLLQGSAYRFPKIIMKNKLGDRMLKQSLYSVIAKYRDLSVSLRSIIRLRQIIDLLATDKLRYFAQPCPIIDNYRSTHCNTAQIWSWCTEYSSSVVRRYPAIYVSSCVGEKNSKIKNRLQLFCIE